MEHLAIHFQSTDRTLTPVGEHNGVALLVKQDVLRLMKVLAADANVCRTKCGHAPIILTAFPPCSVRLSW
jgi:hypothetical protein